MAELHSLTWSVLLAELRRTPERLHQLLAGVPPEWAYIRPDGEPWSVSEIVSHLCAVEPPFRARLVYIKLENNPRVAAIGRITGDYDPHTPIAILLDTFAALREGTVRFLEMLLPEDYARPALHAEVGPTTLRDQVETLLGHDVAELERIATLLYRLGAKEK